MTPDETFSRILKDLRMKLGLSQEQLGFESGFHRTYISQIERGLKSPTLNTIIALARTLGVKPSELFQELEQRMTDS